MNNHLVLISHAVCLCFCLLLPAVGHTDEPVTLASCQSLEFIQQKVTCLTRIVLSDDSRDLRGCAFHALLSYWKHRDGEASHSVSDAFVEILAQKPNFFLEEMSQDTKLWHEWLSELKDLSFTWSSDSPSPLEERKEKLINVLRETEPRGSKARLLRDEVLVKLESIVPRTID